MLRDIRHSFCAVVFYHLGGGGNENLCSLSVGLLYWFVGIVGFL